MLNQKEIDCLRTCNECASACLQCAIGCLGEDQPKPMVHCISLDLECADICELAAASIARGGEYMKAICALCAKAGESCRAECAKHEMEHCKRCAETCKLCAAGGGGNALYPEWRAFFIAGACVPCHCARERSHWRFHRDRDSLACPGLDPR